MLNKLLLRQTPGWWRDLTLASLFFQMLLVIDVIAAVVVVPHVVEATDRNLTLLNIAVLVAAVIAVSPFAIGAVAVHWWARRRFMKVWGERHPC